MSHRSRRGGFVRRSATAPFVVLAVIITIGLFAILYVGTDWNAYLLWWVALGGTAFLYFGLDKSWAQTQGMRIPEVVLHGLTLLGGFVGTGAGMLVFRHKVRKPAFWAVLLCSSAIHLFLAFVWPGLLH